MIKLTLMAMALQFVAVALLLLALLTTKEYWALTLINLVPAFLSNISYSLRKK